MAKRYPGLPKYVLETDYGCYSDYGWTIASTSDSLHEAVSQYNHWSKKGGLYRIVDGSTGEVLIVEGFSYERD